MATPMADLGADLVATPVREPYRGCLALASATLADRCDRQAQVATIAKKSGSLACVGRHSG